MVSLPVYIDFNKSSSVAGSHNSCIALLLRKGRCRIGITASNLTGRGSVQPVNVTLHEVHLWQLSSLQVASYLDLFGAQHNSQLVAVAKGLAP